MASGRLIDYLGSGVAASRPASLTIHTGTVGLYYATDTNVLSAWDGATWENVQGAGGLLAANNLSDVSNAATARTNLGVDTAIAAAIAGLSWKQAVRVATTAAITLATGLENGDTIDGVVLATGDRVLVKNQTGAPENGIYIVPASGAPTRATDADSGAELVNASVYVSEGTANADTQWTCSTNAPIAVGATNIAFAQLSSGGSGGVTAAASLNNDTLVRGDGGAKGVQTSGVTLSDTDELHGYLGKLNFQTGTTYTLDVAGVDTDSGKIIDHANASAITVTLPATAPVGFACTYVQTGAGQITFTAASGGTLSNRQSHTKAAGNKAMVTLYVRDNSGGSAAAWVLGGDTAT